MKICVFSDSHGSSAGMLRAVYAHSPDMVIHLGDGERDLEEIKSQFPDTPVKRVRGNCDWYSVLPETEHININGVEIFMTHGHLYGVKQNTSALLDAAGACGAGLVLYGHTHRPCYDLERGVHVLNPGSCHTLSGTFALILIGSDGDVDCRLLGF